MLHGTIRKLTLALCAAAALVALVAPQASAAPLEVETQAATKTGAYSATLNGRVFMPEGAVAIAGFEYGTTTAYGTETQSVQISGKSGWVNVSIPIEGLKNEHTTYHFRIGAVNFNNEVSKGEDKSFHTAYKPKLMAEEVSGSYPMDVLFASQSADPISFGLEGQSVSCSSLTGTGVVTLSDMIWGKPLSLAPTFSGCASAFATIKMTTNGCKFVLHYGDSGTATGAMDITCPEGAVIEAAAGTCKFTIPAQTGLAPVTMTNNAGTSPTTVDVKFGSSSLQYVKTADGFLCPFKGTGAMSNGTLTGTAALSGSNEGSPLGVRIDY